MPSFQLIVPLNSFSISYLAAFYKEEAKSENNTCTLLLPLEREDSKNGMRITAEPGNLPFKSEGKGAPDSTFKGLFF